MTQKQPGRKRLETCLSILHARNTKGMSHEHLAEASGIGIRTIKRFESGKFWLNSKQLVMLCGALNVEINFKSEREPFNKKDHEKKK